MLYHRILTRYDDSSDPFSLSATGWHECDADIGVKVQGLVELDYQTSI